MTVASQLGLPLQPPPASGQWEGSDGVNDPLGAWDRDGVWHEVIVVDVGEAL